MTKISVRILVAAHLVILKSIGALPVFDENRFSEEIHLDDDDFEGFKHFGHKSTLQDFDHKPVSFSVNLEQKPVPLSLSLNENLAHTFEHNLVGLNIPESYPPIKSSIRYTSTPVETYKVTEDVFEPKPQLSVAKPIVGRQLVLGSGSLGVVNLGNGKFVLGSGSLGYAEPAAANQVTKGQKTGGLHEVQAPNLGSSEAFDAAFNNFDFKPLSGFFDHDH